MSPAYRDIPAVHHLVDAVLARRPANGTPRSLITAAARCAIDEYRAGLGHASAPPTDPLSVLTEQTLHHLEVRTRPALAPVINGTGIIIHTGLGRAPMADVAVRHAAAVAGGYAPVEVDVPSGRRGKRAHVVSSLLTELTGAEAATVVNNTAASLTIVLATLTSDPSRRSVIVSRGELIEIGGSFRLPDVMEAGGAHLREVGTTNRTRTADYERAIDDSTAALMKVHTSNFRVEGFTESVSTEALAALARAHDLTLIDDIGSGALRPTAEYGWSSDEPNARDAIAAGADVVVFSGDKLLGGPQAGIIIGRARQIEAIERHPLMRAMRVDKVTLAALGATLQLHRDPADAAQRVPVMRMVTAPTSMLRDRAAALLAPVRAVSGVANVELIETRAYLGGGSVPAESIESIALSITPGSVPVDEVARRLRLGTPSVFPRIAGGAVLVDLRTVFPEQDASLPIALANALE